MYGHILFKSTNNFKLITKMGLKKLNTPNPCHALSLTLQFQPGPCRPVQPRGAQDRDPPQARHSKPPAKCQAQCKHHIPPNITYRIILEIMGVFFFIPFPDAPLSLLHLLSSCTSFPHAPPSLLYLLPSSTPSPLGCC